MASKELASLIYKARESLEKDRFHAYMFEEVKDFLDVTSELYDRIVRWAKDVGLGEEKKEVKPIPDNGLEKLVAEFFYSHTPSSLEGEREKADLINLFISIANMASGNNLVANPHKFITVSKTKNVNIWAKAPAWNCVIPIGNSNGHDYTLNRPAIHAPLTSTDRFINPRTGSWGNRMTTVPHELIVPSLEVFRSALCDTMYYNLDATQLFVNEML